MKITVFSGPLLLVAVLAVPWVAAAPLESASEDDDVNAALEAFLDQNPSVAEDLYPKLVNAANYVTLSLDEDVVLDLVENYMKDVAAHVIADQLEESEKEEEEAEAEEAQEEHARQKRQTSVTGAINSSRNPFGRSIGGSATVNHAWDNGRHSLSGTVGGQRDSISGVGRFNSYNAGVGYNFNPNKRTSIGVNAHKSWTPAGNSHGFGLSFTHKFGR
ncbi:uncharacterized protein LOC126997570 isoform X1 [Eriocheir sinensis]|uniref:uncharacterized protein LOC126997570 isoform X1 n=1 Tax=Eriocheir sinensis TaxID=95602 RepID=UPI0021C633F8|nr:uncharacterized protein LOC126997570 isoform X1 [Eriocheir sinensis]